MDASGSLPDSQKQTKKFRKHKKYEIDRDIISNLPENVLTHILSFLPTKYVVRTSVLSTKWKDTWTKVTNLHLDDELLSSRKNMTRRAYFMNFVDRILLHLKNSKIQSFYLSCDNYSDASRVSAWISAVIKRQVQKLDIKYRKEEFVVPRCVFGSDSLRKLKLVAKCIIKVSASCFSRLEIVDLSGVTFLNTCFPNTEEITLTFPVLKVLTLCSTKLLNVKVVNLNVPALHSCDLNAYESGWVPDDSHDLLIKICGQDLKKFKCSSSLSENYVLDCASSVTEVNICIISKVDTEYNSQEKTTVGLRACDLLKMFLGVENLTLSWHTIEVCFIILYNLTFMVHQVRSNNITSKCMPPNLVYITF